MWEGLHDSRQIPGVQSSSKKVTAGSRHVLLTPLSPLCSAGPSREGLLSHKLTNDQAAAAEAAGTKAASSERLREVFLYQGAGVGRE